MKEQETLWASPVASLQTMLRQLSLVYDFLPAPPLDGIYGRETLEAVLLYQRERHPPVTGVVDQRLWEALREDYTQQQPGQSRPRVLRAFPEGVEALQFGEEAGEIALFQMMFQILGQQVAGIQRDPPSGVFTPGLGENVRWLQGLSGLEVTGALDRESWDRLARLYEVLVTAS